MGDYMFLLETHLGVAQMRVLRALQELATAEQSNLFLSGGALRDLLGGYPTRDLDFTIEGDALGMARKLAEQHVGTVKVLDKDRKRAELVTSDGVTFEVRQAVSEKYAKPAGKVSVTPATIYEDLRTRDFSMNAIALSLSRASRGLLLDPLNGRSDLESKAIRTAYNMAFYDDPVRLLRLVRFKVRFGMTVEERTQRQFDNAREAGMAEKISSAALSRELANIASEPNAQEVLQALETEGLLELVAPGLSGKINAKSFEKLQKARGVMPFGFLNTPDPVVVLLSVLTSTMNPREKSAFLKGLPADPAALESLQKLPQRVAKLEKALAAPELNRPGSLFTALVDVPGEVVMQVLMQSAQRTVVERLKKFLQQHVPTAQGITDQDVVQAGFDPTSPKGIAKKRALIIERLNARPKKEKPAPPPEPEPIRPYARRRL